MDNGMQLVAVDPKSGLVMRAATEAEVSAALAVCKAKRPAFPSSALPVRVGDVLVSEAGEGLTITQI